MTSQLELDGDVPRSNGELVFDEPWQSRAFGMALAMHEADPNSWDNFRDRLKAEIAADEGAYYECWLAAFERLVLERALITAQELSCRVHEYRTMQRDAVY